MRATTSSSEGPQALEIAVMDTLASTERLPCGRLLCVEHVTEQRKPVLYLVRPALKGTLLQAGAAEGSAPHVQVFEFLQTDLKKYMDRIGRMTPLPTQLVKVCLWSQCPTSRPHWSSLGAVALPQSFMYQLIKGTAHCHLHGVMHRDLKPQNLLVGEDAAGTILKIADLGLGRAFSIPIKTYTHEVLPAH